MQRKELRQRVINNFDHARTQYHLHSPYAKVAPEMLFDMLDEVSGRFRTPATRLLNEMGSQRWYIQSTVHKGGSAANAPWHITVMMQHGIHLDCRMNIDGTMHIYEIASRR